MKPEWIERMKARKHQAIARRLQEYLDEARHDALMRMLEQNRREPMVKLVFDEPPAAPWWRFW